jgi:hypothetical protein
MGINCPLNMLDSHLTWYTGASKEVDAHLIFRWNGLIHGGQRENVFSTIHMYASAMGGKCVLQIFLVNFSPYKYQSNAFVAST